MKNIIITAAFLLLSTPVFAATAYWTGGMELVETITYKIAWRCEYTYLGDTFYKVFRNSCPMQIEVE